MSRAALRERATMLPPVCLSVCACVSSSGKLLCQAWEGVSTSWPHPGSKRMCRDQEASDSQAVSLAEGDGRDGRRASAGAWSRDPTPARVPLPV